MGRPPASVTAPRGKRRPGRPGRAASAASGRGLFPADRLGSGLLAKEQSGYHPQRMRILLTKISDERHALEVVRADGDRERVELVSREFLFHDLLHYAVEWALETQDGFWGALARGRTVKDLNDRTGAG